MTKFDKEYLELCKKILKEGIEVSNRTGINTIKVPNHEFHFDLSAEFPILQSKQTFYKQAVIEMLWIWQMQSNDVRELHKRGVHIWDEWMIDEDGIYRIYEPITKDFQKEKEVTVMDPLSAPISNPNASLKPALDKDGHIIKAKSKIEGKNIKEAKYFGKEYAYTIGTAYGYITNRYQHTQNLINTIKNNPTDRRMVKNLWQDEFLRTAVLPSCVWGTEWDVTNGKLNLSVLQRSCDVPLGLPFNITQYATFLRMIAQVTNLEPGQMNYYIKDAHIYTNQIEGINKQLKRWEKYEEYKELLNSYSFINRYIYIKNWVEEHQKNGDVASKEFEEMQENLNIIQFIIEDEKPQLWINPDIKDFFQFDNSKELKDVKLKKYKHMGKIKFPIAQ